MSLSVFTIIVLVPSFVPVAVRNLHEKQGKNKPTTRQTRHANDFVNAKSHAKEKRLLAG